MSKYLPSNLLVAPFLAIAMVSSAGAVDLLNEDFSGGDGGFTVISENLPTDPWAYDAVAEAWWTDGSEKEAGFGVPNQHTRLTSPELTVDENGGYFVIFDHRYDIEAGRRFGGLWDGAALYIRVNGGSFDYVEATEFTENGYNTGALIGAHVLRGRKAFGGISTGHAAGTYITSMAGPFGFSAGDIVQIQFLMASDQYTNGTMTPNWEIDSVRVTTSGGVADPGQVNFTNFAPPGVDAKVSGVGDGYTVVLFAGPTGGALAQHGDASTFLTGDGAGYFLGGSINISHWRPVISN